MDFINNQYSEKEIRDYIENSPEKLGYWFWNMIWAYQILSEQFIRDFQDEAYWWAISKCQTLSEDFIREFQDKLGWDWISEYQKLSEEFLIEHLEKIDTWYLEGNEKIPKDVKERIYNLKKVIDQ